MLKIKSNRIITADGLLDGYVYVDGGKIVAVTTEDRTADQAVDYTGLYVAPGFIDMHTHGGAGHAFAESTMQDVLDGCDFHLSHGTTTIVPTISAAPFAVMREAVKNISAAKKSGKAKGNILGAHLEGPYLSAAQCGAQCPTHITPPVKEQYESLMKEFGADVTRWTYAPENDKDGSFCKYLTDRGVVVSCGHSNAVYADVARAIENGCNLITHLYSCTSTVTRDHGFRSLGVIESAFLRDELYVEIIADGKHLPPDLIKMIIKIKGKDKVALITDSLEVAGTDIKEGVMCDTPFIIEDGVCKLKDRSAFAGSIATADKLVRVLVQECDYDVCSAVHMLTEVPARILKVNKGVLKQDCDADIVVFDDDVNVRAVYVAGNKKA